MSVLLGIALASSTVRSATFVVNTLEDENDGAHVGGLSLREAIHSANANGVPDTIRFEVAGTIGLTSELPAIETDIRIEGPGATEIRIDGASLFRGFVVTGTQSSVVLRGLTIAHCQSTRPDDSGLGAPEDETAGLGAAIHQAGGAMIVESSTFEDNAAIHGAGGAIFTRSGSIEIINCSFKRNSAIDNFPGPNHELSGKGGAVCIHPDASALGAELTFGQGTDANIADANASTINDDDDIYGTIRSLPTVLSLSRIGPSLSRQDQATYFVTFSERVTGVDASDFAVTATGIEQAHVTPEVRDVSGGSIYSVNVDTGIGSGLIELRLNDDDSIRNANGLSLGGTGAGNGDFASADALAIDRERPTVASIEALPIDLVAPNSITFLVTFDESVSDFDDAGDVFVEHQGTIHDRIEFSPISAANHAVTISGVTGEGGIRLFVKANAAIDQVGNPSLVSAAYGEFYFDDVAPTVASFVAYPRRTSSPDIEFSLRFSEPVIGLSPDDLTIQHDGSRHASQMVEREGEASYRVALSGVEGVGEMTVTLSAGAVTDRVGQVNALWTSDAIAIDTTPEIAPAVSPVQESVDTPASSATDADGIAADGVCGAAMTPMAMVLPLMMALRRRRRGNRFFRPAYARSRRALS